MPRRARLSLPGIPWHIIQRGNNRGVCFFAEEDYRFYLDHLAELAARVGCAIHAYVLMTDHVYLLLTPRIEREREAPGPALRAVREPQLPQERHAFGGASQSVCK